MYSTHCSQLYTLVTANAAGSEQLRASVPATATAAGPIPTPPPMNLTPPDGCLFSASHVCIYIHVSYAAAVRGEDAEQTERDTVVEASTSGKGKAPIAGPVSPSAGEKK